MAKIVVVQVGNPIIRAVSEPFTVEEILQPTTAELLKIMRAALKEAGGVGIAACQVGVNKRVFIVHIAKTKNRPNVTPVALYVVFNPEIIWLSSKPETDWEGCLSVAEANLFAEFKRPHEIRVKYLDEQAQQVEKRLNGIEARVFMHETDHFSGKIFLDHKPDTKSFMSGNEYRAMRKRQIT